jgi:uncharacterized protein (TIGR03083 family)
MLTKQQVTQGTLDEWELFAELISGLTPEQWTAPSRCEGWQARDVAGHVLGTATDVLAGTFGQRTPEDEARDNRHKSPQEQAAELRAAAAALGGLVASLDDAAWNGPSIAPDLTMAEGVLALWYDTWIHADDIRHAAGLPSVRGAGLSAAVEHVGQVLHKRHWGPARIALEGQPEVTVGQPNGEAPIKGDALQFVLVATGRADPAQIGLDSTVNIYA